MEDSSIPVRIDSAVASYSFSHFAPQRPCGVGMAAVIGVKEMELRVKLCLQGSASEPRTPAYEFVLFFDCGAETS